MSEKYTEKDILEMAIQAKDKSVELYMTLARSSENYHVSQLFVKMAQDKKHHKIALQKWYEQLGETAQQEAYPGERSMFLKALVDEKTFKCDAAQKEALEKTINEEEALRASINFEKDFMLFLHELKQWMPSGGSAIIDQLLDEETKNIREMFEIKDKLNKAD